MSKKWCWFLASALVGVALLTPGVASAGVSVGIGVGYGPHHHWHGYYGGWYAWPGPYYYDPWWYDPWYYPAPVVVAPPVVVERPPVVVREYVPPAPPQPPAPDPAAVKIEQKKNEALTTLKIGDVNNRVQAVKTLEPFVGETRIRTALEQAMLADREPQVRKTVAELFCRVQDKKTLPALKQAQANDSDRGVRQAAYKAVIMMEGY